MTAREPSEGDIVAGRFRLVRTLGRGGMGEVWVGHDTRLATACAIKFLRAGGSERAQLRMRFEREAKAAAQLRSPNVVQILDHGEHEGLPYIAMELLEGEDLSKRLARLGRLSPAATLAVVEQVARALTRAHAAGLVHRDLKPANIFLVPDEDREVVKVLDFGIVKTLGTGAPASVRGDLLGHASITTQTGALVGTPHYMSPEQASAGREVDTRSDLWSLAIVVYQCLSGRLPFTGEDFADLVMKILLDPIPQPTAVAPDLPPAIDAWFTRAAAREPSARFQTARELASALASALAIEAPLGTSGPATAPEVAAQAPTVAAAPLVTVAPAVARPRRSALVVGMAVVGVVAVAALSVGLWFGLPRLATQQTSTSSRSSDAPGGASVTLAPATLPGCEDTLVCPDMLHQICSWRADGLGQCVPSKAAAKISVSYEGAVSYSGVARMGNATLNIRDATLTLSFAIGKKGADSAASITVSLKNDLVLGVRAFGLPGPLYTAVTVGEDRRVASARYRGKHQCTTGAVTLVELDLRHGGHVRGTVHCKTTGGADSKPVEGFLSVEFFAEFDS